MKWIKINRHQGFEQYYKYAGAEREREIYSQLSVAFIEDLQK